MGAARWGVTSLAVAIGALVVAPAALGAQAALPYPGTAWRWAEPRPQGNPLASIGLRGGRGYALDAVENGLIRSEDGGRTWIGVPGRERAESRLTVIGPRALLLANCGELRLSQDGGATRKRVFAYPQTIAGSPCAEATGFADAHTGLVGFGDGGLVRTDDGARTFSALPSLPGRPSSITLASPALGFATVSSADGGRVSLLRTTDGGMSWTKVLEAPSLGRIEAIEGGRTAYLSSPAGLLRSDDSGQTFRLVSTGGLKAGEQIGGASCFTRERCLFFLTGSKPTSTQLALSLDGGAKFRRIAGTSGVDDAVVEGTRAIATTEDGGLLTSGDSGASFRVVGAGLRNFAEPPVRRGAGGRLHALMLEIEEGPVALLRSTDRGRSWSPLGALPGSSRYSSVDVAFPGRRDGYVLQRVTGDEEGRLGRLLRTRDGGRRWRVAVRAGTRRARALFSVRGRVFLASRDGLRRLDGRRLHRVRGTSGANLREFSAGRGAVAAFGSRRALWSRDGGRSWRRLRLPPGRALADLDAIDRRALMAVMSNGTTWRSMDGGRRWRALPAAGPAPASAVDFVDRRTGYLDVSGGEPYGIAAFAGGARVLRTDDGGRSWRSQFDAGEEDGVGQVLALDRRRAVMVMTGYLLTTGTGGDPPRRSRLTLARLPRRVRAGATVTIRGAVRPAPRRPVLVSRLAGGKWSTRFVTAGAGGRFTTRLTVRRRSRFVVQVLGDDIAAGAGSPALTVGVRR